MSDGTRASDDTEATDTLRVFFAVELAAAARAAVADTARGLRDAPEGDGVRWVREESFHVTLRFLGDVEVTRIARLAECVRERTAALQPFPLELGGPRCFPSRRRARFLVLDVGPADRLEELAEAVERGVVEAGFDAETRPFRAHLTLGRIRDRKFPAVTGAVTTVGEGCLVEDAVLFQSDLHRSGSRYTPIERVPLGKNGKTSSPLIT
jgi:2'-5' RNA ligase